MAFFQPIRPPLPRATGSSATRIYREGYCAAIDAVSANTIAQNLRLIDDMSGCTPGLDRRDPDAVRAEALRQIETEFRIIHAPRQRCNPHTD